MRNPILVLLAGALLASCGTEADRRHAERLLAMGTWVDVTLDAPDRVEAPRLIGEIEAMLRTFERDYYAWADGELARLNRGLAAGATVHVDPELARLLRAAQRYSALSDGAFEPAVGDLVELWGFHSDSAAPTEPPPAEVIAAWVARDIGIGNLVIDEQGAVRRARGDAAKLDLGGIAKGEAVDRIVAALAAAGVVNGLVSAGGGLRVLGANGARPWRIGIQAPRAPGLLGVLELASGEAAFTSGDYERFYDHEGRRMHHILDPATGRPVEHTQAVTVIAADGVTADAASTALLVAGPDRWREVAAAFGVAMALRVDALGEIEITEPMRKRLQTGSVSSSDIIAPGSRGATN